MNFTFKQTDRPPYICTKYNNFCTVKYSFSHRLSNCRVRSTVALVNSSVFKRTNKQRTIRRTDTAQWTRPLKMKKLRVFNIFKIYDIYSYGFIDGLGLTKSEMGSSQLMKIRKVLLTTFQIF